MCDDLGVKKMLNKCIPSFFLWTRLKWLFPVDDPQGKNIVVFYGSQTGTAEEFANRLSKDAHRYGMKGMAADPEEYDMVMPQYFHLWSDEYSNASFLSS